MASSKKKSEQDKQEEKELAKNLVGGALRKTNRPKNVRELGTTALKNLPATISMVQGFMKVVNWKQAQEEVLRGLNNTIVIVGLPNSGKSTLFNKIKGENLSPVSAQAGTTRELMKTSFGPFTLIDTPGHIPELMHSGMDQASVIVFLIDASKGFQLKDRELYDAIKKMKKPPISARTGQNIAEELIPAIIEASPEAALVIGRELPAYRRDAAQRIIRNATLVSLAAGREPIPLVDIPILLGTQIRLVLRLAALYGEPLSTTEAMKHARELITTIIGGLGLRYLAEQAAKAVPFGGDFVAGVIAGAGTWAIGQVALEYYEGGKQVNPRRLRQLYTDFYRRFRKEKTPEEWRKYALEGKDTPLRLEESKGQVSQLPPGASPELA